MRLLLLAALVALVAAILAGMRKPTETAKPGKRIGGPDAYAGPDGFVPGNPSVLASQAGAGLDVYALARLIASEATGLPDQGKIGVAWAALNRSRRLGKPVSELLTKGGRFARQNVGGMYAATGVPPTSSDLALARGVYSGIHPDPTRGAEYWDSPRAQDALVKRGVKGYSKTAADVAASRIAGGLELVVLPGVPENTLRFWRAKSRALVS